MHRQMMINLPSIHAFCFAGTELLCNVILIPVRNENAQIIMYILNFENLNDATTTR